MQVVILHEIKGGKGRGGGGRGVRTWLPRDVSDKAADGQCACNLVTIRHTGGNAMRRTTDASARHLGKITATYTTSGWGSAWHQERNTRLT